MCYLWSRLLVSAVVAHPVIRSDNPTALEYDLSLIPSLRDGFRWAASVVSLHLGHEGVFHHVLSLASEYVAKNTANQQHQEHQ